MTRIENPLEVSRDFIRPVIIDTADPAIQLRQFIPNDTKKVFQLIETNREHLSQHGDDTSSKYPTKQSVLESITHPSNPDKLRMGIWHEGIYIGTINLIPFHGGRTAEIGAYLGSQYTGQGFMTASAQAMTEYAFARGVHEVFGRIAITNARSIALVRRLGYIKKMVAQDGSREYVYYAKTRQD